MRLHLDRKGRFKDCARVNEKFDKFFFSTLIHAAKAAHVLRVHPVNAREHKARAPSRAHCFFVTITINYNIWILFDRRTTAQIGRPSVRTPCDSYRRRRSDQDELHAAARVITITRRQRLAESICGSTVGCCVRLNNAKYGLREPHRRNNINNVICSLCDVVPTRYT